MQLAADIRSDRDEKAPRVLSYLAPKSGISDPDLARQPLYPETSPLNAYNRLFGAACRPSGNAGRLTHDLSALNYMRRDLARLRSVIPASEKDKLDAYANAVAQLEASLRAKYGNAAGPCVKPAVPPTLSRYGQRQAGRGAPSTPTCRASTITCKDQPTSHPHLDLGQAQLRLIKAAFACDLTRVATFMWASGTSWVVFPGTFQGATIYGNLMSAPHYPPSAVR